MFDTSVSRIAEETFAGKLKVGHWGWRGSRCCCSIYLDRMEQNRTGASWTKEMRKQFQSNARVWWTSNVQLGLERSSFLHFWVKARDLPHRLLFLRFRRSQKEFEQVLNMFRLIPMHSDSQLFDVMFSCEDNAGINRFVHRHPMPLDRSRRFLRSLSLPEGLWIDPIRLPTSILNQLWPRRHERRFHLLCKYFHWEIPILGVSVWNVPRNTKHPQNRLKLSGFVDLSEIGVFFAGGPRFFP